jgi:hypothetical protein
MKRSLLWCLGVALLAGPLLGCGGGNGAVVPTKIEKPPAGLKEGADGQLKPVKE